MEACVEKVGGMRVKAINIEDEEKEDDDDDEENTEEVEWVCLWRERGGSCRIKKRRNILSQGVFWIQLRRRKEQRATNINSCMPSLYMHTSLGASPTTALEHLLDLSMITMMIMTYDVDDDDDNDID